MSAGKAPVHMASLRQAGDAGLSPHVFAYR
jgi:hypothetical protein